MKRKKTRTINPEDLQKITDRIQGIKTFHIHIERIEHLTEIWEVKAKNEHEASQKLWDGECVSSEIWDGEYGDITKVDEVKK